VCVVTYDPKKKYIGFAHPISIQKCKAFLFLGDLDDYLNLGKGQKLGQPHVLLHQPNKILGLGFRV